MDISNGRVFFLGAGFSVGAGVPLTGALLPMAAKLFKNDASGLYERVCGYATEVDVDLDGNPDANSFARLCTHLEFIELREYAGGERWSDDGSQEKLALKFYLAKAIALSTPVNAKIPEHYLTFARSLTPNDIIVTFNWDLLLENAIQNAGLEFCYDYEAGKIHILKLHGSINWINNAPRSVAHNRPDFGYKPLGYQNGFMENEVYCSGELHSVDRWRQANSLIDQVNPMIVLPGYGKAFDVRQLSVLWYRIEWLNLRHGGISVIGLNVSHDDFIIASLFRYMFRSVVSDDTPINIINPDPYVGERFQNIAGSKRVNFHCETFSDESLNFALFE